MGDYWEEFEDVDVTIKRPPKQKITMWIYPRLLQDVKKIAVQLWHSTPDSPTTMNCGKVMEEKMLTNESRMLS